MIASEAGLGKATLYSYFANKADLTRAVFEDAIDEQLLIVERASSAKLDPRSRIRAIAVEQLRHFARHRCLLRVEVAEEVFQNKEMRRSIRNLMMQKYARYTELLEKTFALAAKEGLIRRVDARKVAHVFVAMLHAVSFYWQFYDTRPSPEDDGGMVCDLLFDGLRKV